jgi:zinc transport system ATP-binding protein
LSRSAPVIEVSNVRFGYERETVLERIDLEIGREDFLAIIGPNGGGKTTLLKIILGLLEPWSGRVEKRLSRRRGNIGYVPQFASFDKQFPLRVDEVVRMGRLGRRGPILPYDAGDGQAVDAVLDHFHLSAVARENINELSGGQLQRALIARAVISDPEILFLDEPLGSIDAESRGVVLKTLEDLNRKIPVVVVTHDVTQFGGLMKQVACVNRHLYYHPKGEVLPEMLEQVYGCPVEVVAHGVPHRVLGEHDH